MIGMAKAGGGFAVSKVRGDNDEKEEPTRPGIPKGV
jgi:hypothetical protein